jgi:hypothetical protein
MHGYTPAGLPVRQIPRAKIHPQDEQKSEHMFRFLRPTCAMLLPSLEVPPRPETSSQKPPTTHLPLPIPPTFSHKTAAITGAATKTHEWRAAAAAANPRKPTIQHAMALISWRLSEASLWDGGSMRF